ncbi:MAG: TOBE domain-containing protein [Campylobacterales bacterium]
MKTSAQNQLKGTIKKIKEGAVNAEVVLSVGLATITSIVTLEAVADLGVKEGQEAYALIKASSVLLANEQPKWLSARNIIKGKVAQIASGAVNAKVHLDIGGATLTSVITMDALHDLKLSVGDSAYAIFKASSVILGID